MPDIFSKRKRSEVMSRIRSKNTKVERMVFAYLRAKRVYFQKHYARVVGSPDVAVPSRKIAVFIDGDFWHGRNAKARLPKLNDWWQAKILRNIKRDRAVRATLRKRGWSVLRVWEGELMRIRTREKWLERVRAHVVARGSEPEWHVYVVRCTDGSLYTGITTNVARRIEAHNRGVGAKYTRGRGPVEFVWKQKMKNATEARRLEALLKKKTRRQKLAFIQNE